MALTEKLTAIADAIRGKTGKTEGLTLTQMAAEIAEMEVGGGDDYLEKRITGTLEEYTNENVDKVTSWSMCRSYALKKASFPNCTELGTGAFSECTNLQEVNLLACRIVRKNSFEYCSKIALLDLPTAATIEVYAFNGCTSLKTLILRASSVCALGNIYAFTNSPFASGGSGGTVYCPAVLIEQYQQASNWASLYAAGTCNFVAIEGSDYE